MKIKGERKLLYKGRKSCTGKGSVDLFVPGLTQVTHGLTLVPGRRTRRELYQVRVGEIQSSVSTSSK